MTSDQQLDQLARKIRRTERLLDLAWLAFVAWCGASLAYYLAGG